jgi:hypothetical protein
MPMPTKKIQQKPTAQVLPSGKKLYNYVFLYSINQYVLLMYRYAIRS